MKISRRSFLQGTVASTALVATGLAVFREAGNKFSGQIWDMQFQPEFIDLDTAGDFVVPFPHSSLGRWPDE